MTDVGSRPALRERPHEPEAVGEVRLHARLMAELVADLCPSGRERSIALTRIEEAAMWACAALEGDEGQC